MNLKGRLEKAAQASGVDEPCEGCEARKRFEVRAWELAQSLGLPLLDDSQSFRLACVFCAEPIIYPVGHFTPDEVAAFEAHDGFYWRGELCLPAARAADEAQRAACDRAAVLHYGDHAGDFRRISDDYAAELRNLKTMRLSTAYVCRVPGCECEFPKTVEMWRTNVEVNGYRVDARL